MELYKRRGTAKNSFLYLLILLGGCLPCWNENKLSVHGRIIDLVDGHRSPYVCFGGSRINFNQNAQGRNLSENNAI